MSTNLKPFIARLAAGETLSDDQAEAAFDVIMSGEATPAQIGALLMAMRVRGETVAEITGAVRAMRNRMTAIEAPAGAIDVCGTGGDGAGTLNVSSAVTFVVAGCGVPVAKHGNRALSSRTGGADVLTALGVNVDAPMGLLPSILAEAGCVFMFAPRHHPSMRHAAGPRVELGTRTIFNLLGPLANPARVRRQLTGVFSPGWTRPMAETLAALGHEAAWVVHGMGLDELTVAGQNQVTALYGRKDRQLRRRTGGRRAFAGADRGDPGGRRRIQRLGAGSCAAGGARRLSRHRVAERRRRADRSRPRGRSARRCVPGCTFDRIRSRICRVGDLAAGQRRNRILEGGPMADDIGSMPDVLARICTEVRADVATRKAKRGIDALRQEIAARGMIPPAALVMR